MSQLKILVVEDQKKWRRYLWDAIRDCWDREAEIDIVANTKAALNKLNRKTYDLAIVDLSLSKPTNSACSDLEGLELLHQIRHHRRNQDCLIIVHTAHDKASIMRRAQTELGADDYLVRVADRDDFDDEQFIVDLKNALFDARFKRALHRAAACHRVTFRFDERILLGSERKGAGSEFANPHSSSEHKFGDLLRRANDLYCLLISRWREEARSIGKAVYQTLGDHRLLKPLESARLLAETAEPEQVWLQFSGPSVGLGFPFELLHDGKDYLSLNYPLTRRDEFSKQAKDSFPAFLNKLKREKRDLRVLVVGSNSDGKIPAAESEARLVEQITKAEVGRLGLGHYVNPLVGENATYDKVRSELETGAYDIFHYAGHGVYNDQAPETSGLILKQDAGSSSSAPSVFARICGRRTKQDVETRLLTASALADLVRGTPLQLVYLSSCHGARTVTQPGDGDFLGTLEALAKANIPVALGYRWAVKDNSAEEMARIFYQQLWRTFSPGDALLQARRHIAIELGRQEETWASPILLAQSL